jgi:hypothetical protein
MSKETKDFIVFLINIVAEEFFSGRKDIAYARLEKAGLLSFYSDTFETSHTLGKEYILNEVREKFKQAGVIK